MVSQSVAIKPEDLPFIIRDTVTGVAYDIRSQDAALRLSIADQMLTKLPGQKEKKPWEEWWKEKRDRNYDLLNAAERGDKALVLACLDEAKHGDLMADINAKGLDDLTPLHTAVSEGYIEVVDLLLSRGARVDAVTTSQRSPLHIACNRGYIELIEALVKVGANINAQDNDGNTPCHLLSKAGWGDALRVFLALKPDVSLKNKYGESAIEVAANIEIRQIFAAAAPVPQTEDSYSRTIMGPVIIHNNRSDMIKSLMFRGQYMGKQAQYGPGAGPSPVPVSLPAITAASSGPALSGHAKTPAPSPAPAQFPSPQPSGTNPSSPASPAKVGEIKSRRIKIIEATKRLQDLRADDGVANGKAKIGKQEEAKGAGRAKEAQDDDESIGPDDFDPLHVLGKGSFGEVYLVRYKQTGRMYAMKVLNKRRVMAQNLVKYARAERNVLCFTKHPFIVSLDFAFQTSEKLFMIMEYCPGYRCDPKFIEAISAT